jgi:hypothetical protein
MVSQTVSNPRLVLFAKRIIEELSINAEKKRNVVGMVGRFVVVAMGSGMRCRILTDAL